MADLSNLTSESKCVNKLTCTPNDADESKVLDPMTRCLQKSLFNDKCVSKDNNIHLASEKETFEEMEVDENKVDQCAKTLESHVTNLLSKDESNVENRSTLCDSIPIHKKQCEADNSTLESSTELSYSHAASYWNKVPATVNGMLGGFAYISATDISGSDRFLKLLFRSKDHPNRGRCVDCGAGIGRITQKLLQRHFGKVDLVEQCPVFADKAREIFSGNSKVGEVFCIGLQDFTPSNGVYDVIWVQWVLIYLPDQDLVAFFRRMGQALRPNGCIIVKENFTTGNIDDPEQTILDEEDSSVTRPLSLIVKLAKDAGLTLIRSVQQTKFPKHLFKVYMLAFRPDVYSSDQ